ncbi:hypothetical protein HDU76_001021 [Blyttiomyces sp. JEL0837]|nr:hypothetical protein HDU76_001021 [Blyttiomyces sp. JEL0837]
MSYSSPPAAINDEEDHFYIAPDSNDNILNQQQRVPQQPHQKSSMTNLQQMTKKQPSSASPYRDSKPTEWKQVSSYSDLDSIGTKSSTDDSDNQGPFPFMVVPKWSLWAHLPPAQRKRRRIACAVCTVITGIFLMACAIGIPIMVLIVIPGWITQAFSNTGTPTYNIENVTAIGFVDPNSTFTNGGFFASPAVGAFDLGVFFTETGYKVPLNIPLTLIGPSWWSLSISKTYLDTPSRANPDDTNWVSALDFYVPEDLHIYDNLLHFFSGRVNFRVPAQTGVANKRQYFKLWPLGASIVNGLVECFMTGNAYAVPKILLSDTSNFHLGFLPVNHVYLGYVYDFGKTLVNGGLTLPAILDSLANPSSSTGSSVASGLNFTLTNVQTFTSNTTIASAQIDIRVPTKLPVNLNVTNLTARVNVSSAALAYIKIDSLVLTAGSDVVTINGEINTAFGTTPSGDLVNVLEHLINTVGNWGPEDYLGLDAITLAPGKVDHSWLDEVLNLIVLKVPLEPIYNSVVLPLLNSTLGGTSGSGRGSTLIPGPIGSSGGSGGPGSTSGSGSTGGSAGSGGISIGNVNVGNGLGGITDQLSGAIANATFHLDALTFDQFVDNEASTNSVGGINMGAKLSVSGFNLPLPSSLQIKINAPTTVSLSADRSFVDTPSSASNAGNFVPFLDFTISDPIILQNNVLTASQSRSTFRFPVFPGQSPNKVTPLTDAVVAGLVQCFNLGTANSVPKLRISTNVGFSLGLLQIPAFPFKYDIDVGPLLVKNGLTIPALLPPPPPSNAKMSTSVTSFASNTAPLSLPGGIQLSIQNIQALSSSNDLVKADFVFDLTKAPSFVSLLLANVHARLAISDATLAYFNVDKITSQAGSSQISFTADVAAPWSAPGSSVSKIIYALGELVMQPTSTWTVILDQLSALDGNGKTHAWLEEILGQVQIRLPWSLVYADAIGPFIQNLLSSVLGGKGKSAMAANVQN